MDPIEVRVPGMTRVEALEIQRAAPETIRFETAPPGTGKLGIDPITIAVLILTADSLKILAAWLMKKRQSNRIHQTIEVVYPDGTRRTHTIDINLSSSDAPDAAVLKRVAELVQNPFDRPATRRH